MPVIAPTAAEPTAGQFQHTLPNGLTLLAEPIADVRSAALTLLVPLGAATDPVGAGGSAAVLAEWILRGAGSRDSRGLTDYLDSLGIQRASQADMIFLRLSASMLSQNLATVLPVYADIIQRPHLPADGFDPSIDLSIQQIEGIDDEPTQQLAFLLREQHYPWPYGRPAVGVIEELDALTPEALRADFAARARPNGAILALAGNFDWPSVRHSIEEHFAPWPSRPAPVFAERFAPRGIKHMTQDTNQVQIGLAFDTVPERDPQSILVQILMTILSGGMSSRLWSEIREKQGLCYHVQAEYHSFLDRAAVFGYAGTTPDRAQQTLDAFLAELARLRAGVTADEFARAVTGMKSRVIMQGESSAARAGSIAYDYYYLGHPRTLAAVRQQLEAVTLEQLNAFLAQRPAQDLTVVTLGPAALEAHTQRV